MKKQYIAKYQSEYFWCDFKFLAYSLEEAVEAAESFQVSEYLQRIAEEEYDMAVQLYETADIENYVYILMGVREVEKSLEDSCDYFILYDSGPNG